MQSCCATKNMVKVIQYRQRGRRHISKNRRKRRAIKLASQQPKPTGSTTQLVQLGIFSQNKCKTILSDDQLTAETLAGEKIMTGKVILAHLYKEIQKRIFLVALQLYIPLRFFFLVRPWSIYKHEGVLSQLNQTQPNQT